MDKQFKKCQIKIKKNGAKKMFSMRLELSLSY